MTVDIRLNPDKSLDEVIGYGETTQLEQMDNNEWFLSVGEVQIWLRSEKDITVYYEAPE